ncbi:MAG: trypsin-like peptidase domain-containing protein [Caldilineaceae bacterium]|nr:trypsin-like peptidase domain-containing protein [Caldilineaceae bacterium]
MDTQNSSQSAPAHSPEAADKPRHSNLPLWLALGGMIILLFGCIFSAALGSVLFSASATGTSASSAPSADAPVAAAATPSPVVIALPEDRSDYESAVLANIYEQVNPSVVNISVLGDPHTVLPDTAIPDGVNPDTLLVISSGSGFVWDEAGYIVTNNHVVDGADHIQVTFVDGTAAMAEVTGTDVDSDLAVLHIDPTGYDLRPIRLGTLDDVYVGMRVAAIGNPFGLEGTLTSGIVSATGRSIPARASFSIPGSIQTDAAINPGNSGGPLLNERGELIGVNAQIRSDERANSGVGFAIPVTIVSRVVPALIQDGAYRHAYIGISGQTVSPICADETGLSPDTRGALVVQVLSNTPAARAGIRGGRTEVNTAYPQICPTTVGGDLITAIDDQPVTKFDDILYYLSSFTSPGDEVTLTLLRNGEERTVTVKLTARPRQM